ncbi:MAG: hypothetical protein LGR52_10770 [Candidatus Thiosymbion ectosymbiont of Robbea hypermnestra]|nr:hypothetical protein [Candidatus Thiosymbion ectosymbiont of Robbea hypermnestra]
MSQNVILGIHSDVLGGTGYIEGHAWITVTRNGITRYFGLWPDRNPAIPDNGPGWDIRQGVEREKKPKASRYYKLSIEQEKILDRLLRRNVTWSPIHNCSSWAHEIIRKVVHEDVDADDYLWFVETPRELGRNIVLLEAKDPTSRYRPKDLSAQDQQ